MILNCIGLPDKQSSHTIGAISKELSRRTKSVKALDFIPHFSIRNDFEINESAVANLRNDISLVLREFSPIKLTINKYGFYPWKIIYLDIEKTPELQELHTALMNVIQKYRTSWVAPTLLESPHYEGKQKEYINKYGYQFAYEYYSPHFTVAGNDMEKIDFETVKKELETKQEKISATMEKIVFMNREKNNSTELEFTLL